MLPRIEDVLERIPLSEMDQQRVPDVTAFMMLRLARHKFKRTPSVEDLQQLTDTALYAIWRPNDTLIMTHLPSECEDGVLTFDDRDYYEDGSEYNAILEEDDRYFSIVSSSFYCTIIGKSDHAIAETAAFIWGILGSTCRRWYISDSEQPIDFGVFSPDQLSLLFQNGVETEVLFAGSNIISPAQSVFLARQPHPIFLSFEENLDDHFSDGGATFAEILLQRVTPFGYLKLWHFREQDEDIFHRLLRARTIDKLHIFACETPRQMYQLLTASVKGVGFEIHEETVLEMDWSLVDIVPKELSVSFRSLYVHEKYKDFFCAFFGRIAELGHFVKLEFTFKYNASDRILATVVEELLRAVEANQSLVELQLHHSLIQFDQHLESMFATLESHKSLRYFKIDNYQEEADPGYALLKQLLKRNPYIEVMDKDGNRVTDGAEIDDLYVINCFFRGLKGLTQEPLSLQPVIVGETLMQSASGDFRRSSLLLANYTDILCELVQFSPFLY